MITIIVKTCTESREKEMMMCGGHHLAKILNLRRVPVYLEPKVVGRSTPNRQREQPSDTARRNNVLRDWQIHRHTREKGMRGECRKAT